MPVTAARPLVNSSPTRTPHPAAGAAQAPQALPAQSAPAWQLAHPPRMNSTPAVVETAAPGRALTPPQPTATNAAPASNSLPLGEIIAAVRQELQLYRGEFIERLSDRIALGRSTFNASASVAQNIAEVAEQEGLETFTRKVNGRDVLHVVVNLGEGEETRRPLRALLRRVGKQTVELNYKAPKKSVAYGHVAVRVGGGAFYDLTGTRGVAELPEQVENLLRMVTGREDLSLARRRNHRRFFESRSSDYGPMLFVGMLFAANEGEQKALRGVYEERLKTMKGFNVSGGDASQGVYSCAQYLSEDVPFWNERRVRGTIGANAFARMGRESSQLEAVVVYKTRDMSIEDVKRKLP